MKLRKNNFIKIFLSTFILLEILVVFILVFNINISDLFKEDFVCEDCNVIVIVIDALRVDHLGVYDYERDTSPNIDLFAEKSFVFKNAFSQWPSTKPTISSLFTSLYPSSHGVVKSSFGDFDKDEFLNNSFLTLAELMQNNGFKTLGIISNPNIVSEFNFNQGFDVYEDLFFSDSDITLSTIDFLDKHKQNPFFLYVHYFAPHSPYFPPVPYNELFYNNYSGNLSFEHKHPFDYNLMNLSSEDLFRVISLYDGEIVYVDYQLGLLFDYLEKSDLFKNSLVIITADHGEEFQDHDDNSGKPYIGHGGNLYNTLINVPFIMKFPDQVSGKVLESQIELIDIMPTIAGFSNINIPTLINGTNFLPFIKKDNLIDPVFSELPFSKAIIFNNFKLITHLNTNVSELYDLSQDPFEKINLAEKDLITTAKLKKLIYDEFSLSD